MSLHLGFPLFSSLVFVIGMLFARKAISTGVRPWTTTFLANLWLGIGWGCVAVLDRGFLPASGWIHAVLVGLSFLFGQLFTYLAFQFGDVSVATPIFGVKVLLVAALLALVGRESISDRVWVGALLATIGIGLVQSGTGKSSADEQSALKNLLTIVMALLAALSLSLFDIGLQLWGRSWGARKFLPAMFICTAIFSCGLLPWVDRPARIRKLQCGRILLAGTVLMAIQAMSMSYSLSRFGDATRINIVYALRGLWSVLLAWMLARSFGTSEASLSSRVMLTRLLGALFLLASVFVALIPV